MDPSLSDKHEIPPYQTKQPIVSECTVIEAIQQRTPGNSFVHQPCSVSVKVSPFHSFHVGCFPHSRDFAVASAKQLIGLLKSHVEGNEDRFYDLALQLAVAEEQKGHTRLAEQLRQWVEAGQAPKTNFRSSTPIARPRGELGSMIGTTYPETILNDLILPDSIFLELKQLVTEFHKRTMLEKSGLSPRQKLLLVGPSGTGKTMTASALAGQLKYPLYSVLLHGLISKYMGETAAKLSAIFEAIKTQRGVYLLDEIDALAASRDNASDVGEARRILNSFLQFLDEDTGPSIVVATTNLPEFLDRALLRRFDIVLPYDFPTAHSIKLAMSRRLLAFDVKDVQWDQIVGHASGLSASDVIQAATDAARRAVLRSREKISTKELVQSINRRKELQELTSAVGKPK